MKLSTLSATSTSEKMIDKFGGYNHNLRISENEFYDMENLTGANYPVLSPRGKRGTFAATTAARGMISKDALCYVDGSTLYINGVPITGFIPALSTSDKQLVSMGAYLVILPDKLYINTAHTSDRGSIENTNSTGQAEVTYTLCKLDGEEYDDPTVSDTEPENPSANDLWIDTSSTPHVLKQYSASSAMWTPIATTYVKISSAGIAAGFSEYDGVEINGINPVDSEENPVTQLDDLNGKISILYGAYHDEEGQGEDDYIIVTGIIDEVCTQGSGSVTISRDMPDLDFVIESNNRLWGCRYYVDPITGTTYNEIYACKQGDFKNWNCFMGISTDSYTASCGTDGAFTGAINHLGYPLFFKENFLHKVYGSYPAQYQITTTACRGVQKGAGKSLAIVNETLFYKSRNGICAYDGSLPTEVSSYLGDDHYTATDTTAGSDPLRNGAVAGAFGSKYYISMRSDKDSKWYLFVYDMTYGMWHKEDELRVKEFCACRNELYYIDHTTKNIKTILGSGTQETGKIKWFAETGTLGTDYARKKYISRVLIRMLMPIGSRVRFMIEYDSSGEWEQVTELIGQNLRTFPFTLRPKRCDHFRIKMIGEGDVKIYSITKTLEEGSDV